MPKIVEHFYTIQGEGQTAGLPSYLIRFSECNLGCHYCFGVMGGRRKPRIVLSSGQNKKIYDVLVGDDLLTFDNNHNLVETTVTKTYYREVDEWIELKINNVLYYTTIDHPFFTTRGLIKAKDLMIGDMIYHAISTDKMSFRMIGDKNPMNDPEVVKKSIDNRDCIELGKKLSETIQNKIKFGTYEHSWSHLSKKDRLEARRKISKSKIGNKNPNWKNEYINYKNLKNKCKTKELYECKLCGSIDKKLEVHHLDENKENDNISNMITICHKCHSIIHKRGYNFWINDRKDGKVTNMKIKNGLEVQGVKYININNYKTKHTPSFQPKKLKVYNFSCEPYNTYLVDYMWVHNCDTKYARLDSGEELTSELIDNIATEIPEDCHNIIITGGEPSLQFYNDKFIELVSKLSGRFKKRIEIETNGLPDVNLLKTSNIYETIKLFKNICSKACNRVTFNISPKFDLSCYPIKNIKIEDIYEYYKLMIHDTDMFTFFTYKLVYDKLNSKYIENFVDNYVDSIYRPHIYIMPHTPTECMFRNDFLIRYKQSCIDTIRFCKRKNLRYTPRIHIDVYGLDRNED